MKHVSTKTQIVIGVPAVLLLVLIAGAGLFFDVKISQLTRDVAAIAGLNPLSGFLSNLGILLWCVTASICAFVGVYLKAHTDNINVVHFLLASAILSAYLMLDDLFQFHEFFALTVFGIGQNAVYSLIAICVFVYLVAFRHIILSTQYYLLLLAFSFLGLSVVVDAILAPFISDFGHWILLLEDGAKWLGIVAWCTYYVSTSYQFVVHQQ